MRKKKILVVFGTRPEAIKLAPVILELKKEKEFQTIVLSTGQHREMLNQVLDIFKIKVDVDLDLMKQNQDLYDITTSSLMKLREVYKRRKPNIVLVQGDTTTAFTSALAAFYEKIPVGHIEAGLRSYNVYSPFPEEANRRFISILTKLNFAPTGLAKENLLREGLSGKEIFVTGNTVVDALLMVKEKLGKKKLLDELEREFVSENKVDIFKGKYVLITLHRREKFGEELRGVLESLKEISLRYSDYNFVYPVHLNPNVKSEVEKILTGIPNMILLPPQDYIKFVFLMSKCYFILSDSGGIQEECFVFKKPILILRDVTERKEAVDAGYAFLVGSSRKEIINNFERVDKKLKRDFDFFKAENPFGDGKAAKRIKKIIRTKIWHFK